MKHNIKELKFDEEKHEYTYRGEMYSGVTKMIGRKLKKEFNIGSAIVPHIENARFKGKDIHKILEEYFLTGKRIEESVEAVYVASYIDAHYPKSVYMRIPELLVTNFDGYATAIDLCIITPENKAIIFDYKSGDFNREYCSYQLGFCADFLLKSRGIETAKAFVIATKETFVYEIKMKDSFKLSSCMKYSSLLEKERTGKCTK